MDPEELYQMLMSMSPEELAMLGLGGGPSLSQANSDLAGYGAVPPQLDKKGNVEPFDVEVASKQANLRQDYNAMLADNITGAFGGPASYGIDAFTPTMRYGGSALEQPGQNQLDYYANSGGGWQALVAQEMASTGDAATAAQNLIDAAMVPDEEIESDEMRAHRDMIREALPANLEAPSGAPRASTAPKLTPAQEFAQQYDVQQVYDFANELGSGIAKDPRGGYTDPKTGITYEKPPIEEWSAAAQKYMDLGLPFPTDTYSDQKYLDAMAPVDMDSWAQTLMGAQDDYTKAHKDLTENAVNVDGVKEMLDAYEQQQRTYAANPEPFGVDKAQPGGNAFSGNVGPAARPMGQSIPNMTYGADRSPPQMAEAFKNPNEIKPTWSGGMGAFPTQPQMNVPRPGMKALVGDGGILGGNDPISLLFGKAAARQGMGPVPVDRKKLADIERGRQVRAKRDSEAYGRRTRAANAPADFLAQARQRGASDVMTERGQTPLNDALMQRILAQRAQGLYG